MYDQVTKNPTLAISDSKFLSYERFHIKNHWKAQSCPTEAPYVVKALLEWKNQEAPLEKNTWLCSLGPCWVQMYLVAVEKQKPQRVCDGEWGSLRDTQFVLFLLKRLWSEASSGSPRLRRVSLGPSFLPGPQRDGECLMRIRCFIGAWKRERKSQHGECDQKPAQLSLTGKHLGRLQWCDHIQRGRTFVLDFWGSSTTSTERWRRRRVKPKVVRLKMLNWIFHMFYTREIYFYLFKCLACVLPIRNTWNWLSYSASACISSPCPPKVFYTLFRKSESLSPLCSHNSWFMPQLLTFGLCS